MGSIFDFMKVEDFKSLLEDAKPFFGATFDEPFLIKSTVEWKRFHLEPEKLTENAVLDLEKCWYASLEKGAPDYSVYSHPTYLGDIWTCWCLYSRNSILSLKNPKSLVSRAVTDELAKFDSITDLGCGFGFTTLALKEVLPNLRVNATNLETSYQFKLAKKNFEGKDIALFGDTSQVGQTDIVFASEYFEHFERPIEHLVEVLKMSPKVLILANTFKGTAIGHFNTYKDGKDSIPNSQMARKFNAFLRSQGFKKMTTKIWNQRPALWVRGGYQDRFYGGESQRVE